MGANTFTAFASGKTAKEAFNTAVEKARYDFGHSGYTGTIAEKSSFVLLKLVPPDDKAAIEDWALDQCERPECADKWGPSGCVQIGPEEFVFFGRASS